MAKSKFPPLLRLSYVLQHTAEEALEQEAGVSLSTVRIMSVLGGSGAISQRQVAMELSQTEANVSRQLQSMKKQGLVTITRNKKDSRQRDVKLTGKGSRKYQSADKILKKHQKHLLTTLSVGESKVLQEAAQKLS
ncbi:MAG TPA: MarR family winged helix-turn-helix transcriptional regulator [Candidatus Saccharimonadales bacterium]|nr:MarR family winged helix-turn-helix transcriptional regulator [Candidatus Saccharimonadales bacterium]